LSLKATKVGTYTPALNPDLRPVFALDADASRVLDEVKKQVGGRTPRLKGLNGQPLKPIPLYSLACDERLKLMAAILVRSPAASANLKLKLAAYCQAQPVVADAGAQLVRAKLDRAKKRLGTIEDNLEAAYRGFETGLGPGRNFLHSSSSKRFAQCALEDVKRARVEDAD